VAEKHGDLSFVRVYSGTLKAGSRAWNPLRQKKENIAQIWHVQADRREQVEQAEAGDIVGVIGPRASITGDTRIAITGCMGAVAVAAKRSEQAPAQSGGAATKTAAK
jgi:translation elongation factor EF-G